MIQKTIRDWGSVEFTTTEGAEQQTEWNDRTVFATDGYNSIAELGTNQIAIEAKTDFITVTQAVDLDAMELITDDAALKAAVNTFTKTLNIFNGELIIEDLDNVFSGALLLKDDSSVTMIKLGYGGSAGQLLVDGQTIFNFRGEVNNWQFKDNTDTQMMEVDKTSGMSADVNTIALIDSGANTIVTTKEWTEQQYGAIAAVALNTAKNSYPSADSTKLSGIETAATADQLAADVPIVDSGTIITATDVEGALAENRTAIDLNTAKVTYPSADSTKVGHISVTQAVDLDTMESDITTNNAKTGVTTEEANTIDSELEAGMTGEAVVLNVLSLTQAQYDAGTKTSTTFYIITDA